MKQCLIFNTDDMCNVHNCGHEKNLKSNIWKKNESSFHINVNSLKNGRSYSFQHIKKLNLKLR